MCHEETEILLKTLKENIHNALFQPKLYITPEQNENHGNDIDHLLCKLSNVHQNQSQKE